MGNFTAGMFKCYKHSVEELVNKGQGFYFMNQIRRTPAYTRKRFQYEALAMIKQLEYPTFFFNFILYGLEMERNTRSYFKIR